MDRMYFKLSSVTPDLTLTVDLFVVGLGQCEHAQSVSDHPLHRETNFLSKVDVRINITFD